MGVGILILLVGLLFVGGASAITWTNFSSWEKNFTEINSSGYLQLRTYSPPTETIRVLDTVLTACCSGTGTWGLGTNGSYTYNYGKTATQYSRASWVNTQTAGNWSLLFRKNQSEGAFEFIWRFIHAGNDVTQDGAYIYDDGGTAQFGIPDRAYLQNLNWAAYKWRDGNRHWWNVTKTGNNWIVYVDDIEIANATNKALTITPGYSVAQHNDNAFELYMFNNKDAPSADNYFVGTKWDATAIYNGDGYTRNDSKYFTYSANDAGGRNHQSIRMSRGNDSKWLPYIFNPLTSNFSGDGGAGTGFSAPTLTYWNQEWYLATYGSISGIYTTEIAKSVNGSPPYINTGTILNAYDPVFFPREYNTVEPTSLSIIGAGLPVQQEMIKSNSTDGYVWESPVNLRSYTWFGDPNPVWDAVNSTCWVYSSSSPSPWKVSAISNTNCFATSGWSAETIILSSNASAWDSNHVLNPFTFKNDSAAFGWDLWYQDLLKGADKATGYGTTWTKQYLGAEFFGTYAQPIIQRDQWGWAYAWSPVTQSNLTSISITASVPPQTQLELWYRYENFSYGVRDLYPAFKFLGYLPTTINEDTFATTTFTDVPSGTYGQIALLWNGTTTTSPKVSSVSTDVAVSISCPVGWCYAALNYTSKTLLELDNLFSTDTIQGHYNATSQKYESHRTGYNFNQNVTVAQKEGYYYYFTSAQDVTMTPGSTPSITLKQGWNLVGNYGSSARTLSALKTSIGVSATQAKYYDKSLKTWVSTDSQSVPAMESFFVYVTSQTDWSD